MKQKSLIPTLKEYGISDAEVRELLIFTLNTKDRQEQLLNWILANEDTCNKETIRKKAQELLQTFLAPNPYNAAAKNMSPPKWEPPPEPTPTATITPPEETTARVEDTPLSKETPEDVYYKRLLDIFKL